MSGAAADELFDYVPKRSGVVSHSVIASHDRHDLWRFAEPLCRRKVHGIERTDRFDWKRRSHEIENVSVDIEDEAASLEGAQGTNGSLFLGWRQPSGGACPYDRPAGLSEG